jgi:hypothetical protein
MAERDNRSSWISRLRRREAPKRTDWGDLGTAIGMEMSLGAPTGSSEDDESRSSQAPASHAPRWWSRRK